MQQHYEISVTLDATDKALLDSLLDEAVESYRAKGPMLKYQEVVSLQKKLDAGTKATPSLRVGKAGS